MNKPSPTHTNSHNSMDLLGIRSHRAVPPRLAFAGDASVANADTEGHVTADELNNSCRELFRSYPMAVEPANPNGTVRSMTVMLPEGDNANFYAVAYRDSGAGRDFSVWSWPRGKVIDITPDLTEVPADVVDAVTHGVPVPRDGSLFGWLYQRSVSALVVIYNRYTKSTPYPGWSVMPLAGLPTDQWPPFTSEDLLGNWSWDHLRNHDLVSLDSLVAQSSRTVFWATPEPIHGYGCCVVAHDVVSPEGYTLPKGRYLYYRHLKDADSVPSIDVLLADQTTVDLAPRFQQIARGAA